MKTIQELADELGITYDALRKQMQREPMRSWMGPFLVIKGTTKLITDEGERIIRWQYPEKDPKIKELEELVMEKENQVKELLAMLRQELEGKNARIRQLEEELAAEQEKNKALLSIQEKLVKIEQSVSGNPSAAEEKESGLFAWQKRK